MRWLSDLIAVVSPRAAMQREIWRQGYEAFRGQRGYQAADRGRLANGRRAGGGSADAELIGDLSVMRNNVARMERDNTYVAAAKRNLVVWLVGDGIVARATHPKPEIAAIAQAIFDEWALTRVDGRNDFYGTQKLSALAMIGRGDALTVWRSYRGDPDGLMQVFEGDYLDHTLNRQLDNGGKIVGGVEFDADGIRVAYHMHTQHPGDLLARRSSKIVRVDARDIDHVFEETRAGLTRGVPWFHAGVRPFDDIAEIKEAIRVKKRLEACLGIFRRPGEGSDPQPLGERKAQTSGPDWETMRPGMIINGRPGEEAPTVINPSSSGDGDGFLRAEATAALAACGVPAHLGTGDVSQANYSSIRTDMVGFYLRLDDWVFNVIVPHFCDPAFARVMRKASLKMGMPELLKVKAVWSPPTRPWVDPLKDIMAKILEARAIPGALADLLAERGLSMEAAAKLQAEINAIIDKHGLALDSDPRRVNGSGALQPAAGYLLPKGDQALLGAAIRLLGDDGPGA